MRVLNGWKIQGLQGLPSENTGFRILGLLWSRLLYDSWCLWNVGKGLLGVDEWREKDGETNNA